MRLYCPTHPNYTAKTSPDQSVGSARGCFNCWAIYQLLYSAVVQQFHSPADLMSMGDSLRVGRID